MSGALQKRGGGRDVRGPLGQDQAVSPSGKRRQDVGGHLLVPGSALARVGWATLLIGVLLAWLAAAVFVFARRHKPGGRVIVVMGPFLLAGFATTIISWGST